ncbi:MAG: hypothetical protein IJT05_04025 [Lachnospiraceae bacterium]|nr:hypothetical protein [Lachnospiraceae bacterium]
MNNSQLTPFERNRYYAGKMLTSADFQAEQTYFNNKRRFANSLLYGAGVICGLGVFSLDDLSVLIESGVAIDGMGREVVIDSSVVKKLSAVDGFDALRTNEVSLCLRYKEDEVHTVYSVNRSDPDREYEYNRISESYQIFLLDTEDVPESFEMETEFLTRGVLLNDENFMMEFIMPATVSRGRNVKAVLRIEKISDADVSLSYSCILQIPAFADPDGNHEIQIVVDDVLLARGEVLEREYWMTAQEVAALETTIILKSGSVQAFESEKVIPAPSNLAMKIQLSDVKPRELVNREIGRMNLEMKNVGGQSDFIRLADLVLVRTDSAYIIEQVNDSHVKHYIAAPAQERLRNDYMEYFIKEADIRASIQEVPSDGDQKPLNLRTGDTPEVETGILEIPLSENARRGDICYSGEIMHGLGKGNVYVEVGYEHIRDDEALGEASAKSTIYGNPALFADDQKNVVEVETAVRVLNDKGSFVVAVRLLQNVDFLVLTFRWVAIKFPAGNDLGIEDDYSGKSIAAETPTITMGTKESHFFGVRYNNMDPCSITYELTEANSGEITADGIYTAPGKEGVYEIRIYCTDMPVVCTYAYAIVKKKGFDEEG